MLHSEVYLPAVNVITRQQLENNYSATFLQKQQLKSMLVSSAPLQLSLTLATLPAGAGKVDTRQGNGQERWQEREM